MKAYKSPSSKPNSNELPKSTKHGRAVIADIIQKDDTQKKILVLRVRHNITPTGYPQETSNFYAFPKDWTGRKDIKRVGALLKDIADLTYQLGLPDEESARAVWEYIFFNKITFSGTHSGPAMCKISDRSTELLRITRLLEDQDRLQNKRISDREKDFLIESIKQKRKGIKSEYESFPLEILISPYASLNDIITFIREHKDQIKLFQNIRRKGTVTLDKIRSKKNYERDNFIYRNRARSRRKIASLVLEKYGDKLEAGHITTIIKQQTKRRE